jgi:hypothetical protein
MESKSFQNIRGILLVGLMGTGKTSYAHLLSRLLGWRSTDADDFISQYGAIDLTDARISGEREGLQRRRQNIVKLVTSPLTLRVILATTLRPLATGYPDNSEYEKQSGILTMTEAIIQSIQKQWLVVHLHRDHIKIAQYLTEHPSELHLRAGLLPYRNPGELSSVLAEHRQRLAPTYAKYSDAVVDLPDGPASNEGALRILTAVFQRILPRRVQ